MFTFNLCRSNFVFHQSCVDGAKPLLIFLASAVVAAGPLEIATWAAVVLCRFSRRRRVALSLSLLFRLWSPFLEIGSGASMLSDVPGACRLEQQES